MGRDLSFYHGFPANFISIHAPAWGATKPSSATRFLPAISIHAPAWGATIADSASQGAFRISIHAPAWGATRCPFVALSSNCHFNPRARVGRDAYLVRHAPRIVEFQSTRPRGARPAASSTAALLRKFQSTRPRGARPWCLTIISKNNRFQSTRPRGARPRFDQSCGMCVSISIHAPAWGATIMT